MKVRITGAKGMLGRTLLRELTGHECVPTDLPELDLTEAGAVDDCLDAVKPDAVVHGAAMTAVDACETSEYQAMRVNGLATAHIAMACQRHGARLIAMSTDYCLRWRAVAALPRGGCHRAANRLGRSKLAGELAVRRHCSDHTILRIAWLYGPGGPSFVHTMLELGAQAGEPVIVVADEIGNPTSARAVAQLI